MNVVFLKRKIANFTYDYLYSKRRIAEFFIYTVLLIATCIAHSGGGQKESAFIVQVMGFIALFFAFRYGIYGMSISIVVAIIVGLSSLKNYLSSANNYSLLGFYFSLITIFWLIVVGTVSYRQEKYRKETRMMELTDELTGVFNKRFFHITLENELKKSVKQKCSIGLIMIDIDNFSMYNDLYGYNYGDELLRKTADILKKIIDDEGLLFRYECDGFAVLVKDREIKSLEQLANDLLINFDTLKISYYDVKLANKITISIGVSVYPSISTSKDELLSHASAALYQAKNMGEDKVNFYKDVMMLVRENVKSEEQIVGVFKGLLSTMNAKENYTYGHCERVSNYAVMIGKKLGLEASEIHTLLYAGLLQDIGKIEVPKYVLNKSGILTEEEYKMICKHPIYSANILEPLSGKNNLIDYVIHHHERFDGDGYPHGLKGDEISLGARILCVADCFDAMLSERPYRRSMSKEEAFLELKKCSGSQFDPMIVEAFIDCISMGE